MATDVGQIKITPPEFLKITMGKGAATLRLMNHLKDNGAPITRITVQGVPCLRPDPGFEWRSWIDKDGCHLYQWRKKKPKPTDTPRPLIFPT